MIIHCYFGIPLSGPATADKVLVLDHLSLLYTRFVTIVTITKLSKQTSSCSWIILLNSPGGSILQWVDRQGLLCVASVVFFVYVAIALTYRSRGAHKVVGTSRALVGAGT